MSDINKTLLIGRLTRDAEISYTQGESAVVKFSIASNHSVKKGDKWEDDASFFDIVYFGKPAEGLQPFLTKGKQVGIEAHLKQDRWTDKETGKQRSKISIIAENAQLLGGRGDGNGSQAAPQSAPSAGFKEDIPYSEPSDIPFW